MVLFTGIGVITFLLGLNIFGIIGLVVFFYCIIWIICNIMDEDNPLLYNSVWLCIATMLLCITAFIAVNTFTDIAITPEFQKNYPHLSKMDIILIYLGAARIMIDIVFNNNLSYYAKIKKTIQKCSAYLKENPLFYLSVGLGVFLVFIVLINIYTLLLGITINRETFFLFYIFLVTKLILVNTSISLILLPLTKSKKERYNILGMNIWLPLALIPSGYFYYIVLLPHLISIKLAFVDLIQGKLHIMEQGLETNMGKGIDNKVESKDPCLQPSNRCKKRSFEFIGSFINLSLKPLPVRIVPGHSNIILPFSAKGCNHLSSYLYKSETNALTLTNEGCVKQYQGNVKYFSTKKKLSDISSYLKSTPDFSTKHTIIYQHVSEADIIHLTTQDYKVVINRLKGSITTQLLNHEDKPSWPDNSDKHTSLLYNHKPLIMVGDKASYLSYCDEYTSLTYKHKPLISVEDKPSYPWFNQRNELLNITNSPAHNNNLTVMSSWNISNINSSNMDLDGEFEMDPEYLENISRDSNTNSNYGASGSGSGTGIGGIGGYGSGGDGDNYQTPNNPNTISTIDLCQSPYNVSYRIIASVLREVHNNILLLRNNGNTQYGSGDARSIYGEGFTLKHLLNYLADNSEINVTLSFYVQDIRLISRVNLSNFMFSDEARYSPRTGRIQLGTNHLMNLSLIRVYDILDHFGRNTWDLHVINDDLSSLRWGSRHFAITSYFIDRLYQSDPYPIVEFVYSHGSLVNSLVLNSSTNPNRTPQGPTYN